MLLKTAAHHPCAIVPHIFTQCPSPQRFFGFVQPERTRKRLRTHTEGNVALRDPGPMLDGAGLMLEMAEQEKRVNA